VQTLRDRLVLVRRGYLQDLRRHARRDQRSRWKFRLHLLWAGNTSECGLEQLRGLPSKHVQRRRKHTCNECEGSHSESGSSLCVNMSSGYYFNGAIDRPCIAGRFSASGTNDESGCQECGNGKYSENGAAYCNTAGAGKRITKDKDNLRVGVEDCGANTFSTGANDDCAVCEGGHSEAGSSSCVNTPQGHYFDISAGVDKPCPASTFNKDGATSLDGCTPCVDEGSYSNDGASFCLFSPAGFRPTSNRTGTTICPAGSVSSISQDNCTLCEIGKFSETAGSNECRFCSKEDAVVGSITKRAGSSSVDDCICPNSKYVSQRASEPLAIGWRR